MVLLINIHTATVKKHLSLKGDYQVFDLITGLPIHPLISHAVVVLVPLAAVGALVLTFRAKWRATYSPLVLIATLLSLMSAYIATQSGEALSSRVGLPNSHSTLGERLALAVLIFSITFPSGLQLKDRRACAPKYPSYYNNLSKLWSQLLRL